MTWNLPKRSRKRRKAKQAHSADKMRIAPARSALDLPPDKTDSPPQEYRDARRANARTLADAEIGSQPHVRRGFLESLTLKEARSAAYTGKITAPEWRWYAVLWRNAAPRYMPNMDEFIR